LGSVFENEDVGSSCGGRGQSTGEMGSHPLPSTRQDTVRDDGLQGSKRTDRMRLERVRCALWLLCRARRFGGCTVSSEGSEGHTGHSKAGGVYIPCSTAAIRRSYLNSTPFKPALEYIRVYLPASRRVMGGWVNFSELIT
jgi:hypothetical protein